MRSPTKATPKGGRLNLFLLEMIIVLLFFSIAAAVILQAFAAADRISAENIRLERMTFCAQSAAEIFSDACDIGDTARKLFGIDSEAADKISIPLDRQCGYSPADAEIYMVMTVTERNYDGRFIRMEISFTDKENNILYSIETAAYDLEGTVNFYDE